MSCKIEKLEFCTPNYDTEENVFIYKISATSTIKSLLTTIRDKLLAHIINLTAKQTNVIYNILEVNGIYNLFDILSISFVDNVDIPIRVRSKRPATSLAVIIVLGILKVYSYICQKKTGI